MREVSITKEFTWDMAHMLAGHLGLCKNLHGHTYKMQVTVKRKTDDLIRDIDDSAGMVVDFKDLKEIVQQNIVQPLDHAFVYWTESPDPLEHQIAKLLLENDRKVVCVKYRPTAEEMAFDFINNLNNKLGDKEFKVTNIKIWETPTSFAEVKQED
jgi:6-pyruvoyltetrahydropterin/6-carboxytetrahydropterin synthase